MYARVRERNSDTHIKQYGYKDNNKLEEIQIFFAFLAFCLL